MKRLKISVLTCAALLLIWGVSAERAAAAELTQAQAVARVRTILRNNTAGCKIKKVNSVSAVRISAGWRVTARIVMAASGSPISERAVWIVSQKNGAVEQDQLTAEIAIGCP